MRKVKRYTAVWLAVTMIVTLFAAVVPYGTVEAKAKETADGGKALESSSESGFVHPGILHTSESIAAVKKNIENGVQPTTMAYGYLLSDGFSNPGWGGRPLERVERGSGTMSNVAQMYIDIERAYHTALLYNLGAGDQYGDAAVRILNGWAHTMKSLGGNSDRFLAAGIHGYQFANAAELVRDHKDFDKEAMDTLLLNVFYPMNHDFLVRHNNASNGNYYANWDLCNIASVLAIGIFCDRRDIYDEGIEYYKNGIGMGSVLNTMPYVFAAGEYGEELAQWQESGRDQGHATLGIGLCGAINEIAWSQGDDLYGLYDNRFLKAVEYTVKYNNGGLGEEADHVPYSSYRRHNSANNKYEEYPGVSGLSRYAARPVYTAVYNHYVNRMGLEAPQLETWLYSDPANPRVEGGQRNGDEPGWQSLMFHNISTQEEGAKAEAIEGPLEDGIYRIYSKHSRKCLVDQNGLLQSAAKGAMDEEWWEVKNDGTGGYVIRNAKTGRYIQIDGNEYTSGSSVYALGTRFVLSNTASGDKNQTFAFLKNRGDYVYRIALVASSRVMELQNANTADDAGIGQWMYEQGAHSEWIVEKKETKKEIAYFNFDNADVGLSGAGAVAAVQGTASYEEDDERGSVIRLDGSSYLTAVSEDNSSLLDGLEEYTISCYSKADGETSWRHTVAVCTADGVKLYVNGTLKSTAAQLSELDVEYIAGSELVIGKYANNQAKCFAGLLDDFTVYNYALDESSIAAMERRELVAEFTFDDTLDGFVSSGAKADNAGTVVLSDDAHRGRALSLDGSGRNWLKVTDRGGAPLLTGWKEMSISYWSKADSADSWIFYASQSEDVQIFQQENYIGGLEKNGTISVERYNNTNGRPVSISETAQADVWKHIAVTFSEGSTKLYVNGEKKAELWSHHSLEEILGDNSVFYIGKANWSKGSEYCNALIDDVRIYNYVLSNAQAAKDYAGCQAEALETDGEDHTADKAAAQQVFERIRQIGTVEYTDACRIKIADARNAYDALTDAQKAWVTNYTALVSAEKAYALLAPIDKKLLAHFTFDDEDTGFASGSAQAKSDSTPYLTDNAVSGKALRLDGSESGNYLTLLGADGKSLLNGCKEVTVSYWGKLYGTGANWGFYAAPTADAQRVNRERYLGVYDAGDNINLVRSYNVGERATDAAAASERVEWRYITAVYSETGTRLYIDGTQMNEVASGDTVAAILDGDGVCYLGKANWGTGEYYNGLMDEVSIYNYALSDEEIAALYQKHTAPEMDKSLIAEFTFDDAAAGFKSSEAAATAAGTNVLTEDAVSGKALSLDGTGANYLSVTDKDGKALLKDYDEITVSYWSKVKQINDNYWIFYVSKDDNAQEFNNESYLGAADFGTSVDVTRWKNSGSREDTIKEETLVDEWRQTTIVYGRTSTSVYINGKRKASAASSIALPNITGGDGVFYLGKANWGSGEYFNGLLDEVKIYNYALSEAEITELYADGIVGETEDQSAAKAVDDKIAAIGIVDSSDACKARIDEARAAYEALTDKQKLLVTRIAELEAAEKEYAAQVKKEDAAKEEAAKEQAAKEQAAKEQEQAAKEQAQAGTIALEELQSTITTANTDNGDVPGSSFAVLKLKVKEGSKSIKLSWSKVSGAEGYLIFGSVCGAKLKLLGDVSASAHTYTDKKLAKGKYYKYMAVAYRSIYGEKRAVATSVSVHAATNGGKYGNPTSISAVKPKLSVRKGKTVTLKAKMKSKKKVKTHIAKLRYESSNPEVATVTKKGKIKGMAKGSCYIYVYTQNGVYKRVKVTVK